MLVTGNDVLNYKGDAALGGTVAGNGAEVKQMNDAMMNMAYLNAQKNKAVWEQKVKDRDAAMDLIKSGNIQMDQVPPEYRDILGAMKDEFTQLYLNNGGDLKSDPKVWGQFNDKLAKFNEASTAAKSKLIAYNEEKKLAAAETNPIKKKKMLENMEANMQTDVFEPYMPYQQTLDWDATKTDLPIPTKTLKMYRQGDNEVTETGTDIEKYRQTYYQHWANNENGDEPWHYDAFMTGFLGNDGTRQPGAVLEHVDIINKKLADINKQEGWDENNPNYIKPLQVVPAEGEKLQTTDNMAEAMFKIHLAKNYTRGASSKFNLDYAKQRHYDAQTRTEGAKERNYNANISYLRAKTDGQQAKNAALKEQYSPAQFYDEIFTGKTWDGVTPTGNHVTRINAKHMSAGLKSALGISPLNEKGDYTLFPSNVYVGGQILANDDLEKAFMGYRAKGGKKNIFGYLAEKGIDDYEVDVIGKDENGNVTRSNKLTSWINQRKDMGVKDAKSLLQDDNETVEIEQ